MARKYKIIIILVFLILIVTTLVLTLTKKIDVFNEFIIEVPKESSTTDYDNDRDSRFGRIIDWGKN